MLRIEGQLEFTKPHVLDSLFDTRNTCWIRQ